jgi:putative membrane protein
MVGSLRKIWPWKEVVSTVIDRHGQEVPQIMKNVLPPWTFQGTFNTEIVFALIVALAGFGVVIVLERLATRKG